VPVRLAVTHCKTVSYKIAHNDADFVIENPSVNAAGKLAPFANFGAVI
jgi:hypothetical protein